MNPRYFNLKMGKPGTTGSTLKLSPDETLEQKLEDFVHPRNSIESDKFKFLRQNQTWTIYELTIPKLIFAPTKGAYSLKTGKPTTLQLKTKGSKLELYKTGGRKVYLHEITEEEAQKAKSDAESWNRFYADR